MDAGRTLQLRVQKEHGETSYDRNGKINNYLAQLFRLLDIWCAFCCCCIMPFLYVGLSYRDALVFLKCS
jgi:hypothetical protein